MSDELTLVIDIGKSHAKLLMVDAQGAVLERFGRANASVPSPLGYPALDVQGLEDWMAQTLRGCVHTARCSRVITSTHGAALVALGGQGLAWDPVDYEFDGLALHPLLAKAFDAAADGFASTLSPDLPAGLNAARQLFQVQHLHPEVWRRTHCLLPYAQYWAWRLSGVAASEVSSLGCHTHLWRPQEGAFSALAQDQGWAALFAPLRSAWEVLGTVTPEIATAWGLPAHCQVHVGVHDSNACLARYLDASEVDASALTVVSSGTWTVLMAPGAPTASLQAERDMLANVDVLGRATPTARFMGGREFAHLLDGASPDAGTLDDVQALVDSATLAMPSFAEHGGPFMGRQGMILREGKPLPVALPHGQRAALAALYCAQTTAWLVERLWDGVALPRTVVLEGPLAQNALYLALLQALLPQARCLASHDAMEGTARGTWLLARWGDPAAAATTALAPVEAAPVRGLPAYHAQWIASAA
ncbi:L-fuculose kinase [Rhodoferax sp. TH121]|uniref:L-fuculose kinase n=1 Tax=Rhodoferax sp. TH121 TaxID=2022803 RepID=UPI0015955980|nr:L-fuculose kinase [Rhodoferax sp. TH121]